MKNATGGGLVLMVCICLATTTGCRPRFKAPVPSAARVAPAPAAPKGGQSLNHVGDAVQVLGDIQKANSPKTTKKPAYQPPPTVYKPYTPPVFGQKRDPLPVPLPQPKQETTALKPLTQAEIDTARRRLDLERLVRMRNTEIAISGSTRVRGGKLYVRPAKDLANLMFNSARTEFFTAKGVFSDYAARRLVFKAELVGGQRVRVESEMDRADEVAWAASKSCLVDVVLLGVTSSCRVTEANKE